MRWTNGGRTGSIEFAACLADQDGEVYEWSIHLRVLEARHLKAESQLCNDYRVVAGCMEGADRRVALCLSVQEHSPHQL